MHIPAAFLASRTGVAPDPGTGGRRGGGSMLFIHIDPTGVNPAARVADLTLTYRVLRRREPQGADRHAPVRERSERDARRAVPLAPESAGAM